MQSLLSDSDFISTHRVDPKYFTRERKLPFQALCWLILTQLRSAIQLELERFFVGAFNQLDQVPVPSAFTKARRKLNASAFVALNQRVQDGIKSVLRSVISDLCLNSKCLPSLLI